ncbi:MAG: ABC transporter permease, partial [Rhodobacteraceae bacterium]
MNSFFLFSIIFWIAAWIINIFIAQSNLAKTKMVLPPILFGVSLLLIWEASISAFDVSPVILPAPSLVFIKL